MSDNAPATPHDTMMASLEAVGETGVDIVPLYFQRYFAIHPTDEAMFYNRQTSQGTMVNEMLTALLSQAEGSDWVHTYLRAQITTHHDKGVFPVERYRAALDILVDVLRDTAGDRWSATYDAAWRNEAARMYELIVQYY